METRVCNSAYWLMQQFTRSCLQLKPVWFSYKVLQ